MFSNIIQKSSKYYYIILPIIAFAIYYPIIFNDFVYCDDHDIVLVNTERIDNLNNIGDEFSKGYIGTNYYRPMIYISFILNYAIGGKNPMVYQITDIALHSVAGILLFILLVRLKLPKPSSIVVAIIFIIHPLFNNAVAWIVGRNDIIWGIFSLIAFIQFIKYLDNKNIFNLFLHSLTLLLAFLSKETSLVFPGILFSYYFLIEYKKINKFEWKLISILFSSWLIPYAIYFIMKSNAELGASVNSFGIQHILSNWRIPVEYIAKFFMPIDLMVLSTLGILNTTLGIIFSILGGNFIFKKAKINPLTLMGLVWFLLTTIPFLYFNLLNSNDWNEYLECRSYMPMIGVLIIIVSLVPKSVMEFKTKLSKTILILIFIFFISININESIKYKNSITFYESLTEDDPSKALFHFMLSRIYRSKGQYDKEEKSLLNSYKANNTYSKYPYSLGAFYFKNRQFSKAIFYFKETLKLSDDYDKIYFALGQSYFATGETNIAYKYLEIEFDKSGYEKELVYMLISSYLMNNKFDEAEPLLIEAQKRNDLQADIAESLEYVYMKLKNEDDTTAMIRLKDFRKYINLEIRR